MRLRSVSPKWCAFVAFALHKSVCFWFVTNALNVHTTTHFEGHFSFASLTVDFYKVSVLQLQRSSRMAEAIIANQNQISIVGKTVQTFVVRTLCKPPVKFWKRSDDLERCRCCWSCFCCYNNTSSRGWETRREKAGDDFGWNEAEDGL